MTRSTPIDGTASSASGFTRITPELERTSRKRWSNMLVLGATPATRPCRRWHVAVDACAPRPLDDGYEARTSSRARPRRSAMTVRDVCSCARTSRTAGRRIGADVATAQLVRVEGSDRRPPRGRMDHGSSSSVEAVFEKTRESQTARCDGCDRPSVRQRLVFRQCCRCGHVTRRSCLERAGCRIGLAATRRPAPACSADERRRTDQVRPGGREAP